VLTTRRRRLSTIVSMEERRDRLGVRWIDVAVAAAVVFVVVMGSAHIDADASERGADALAYVCGVTAAAALAFWRRFTVAVVVVVTAAMFVYLARGYPGGPALLPGPLAVAALGYRAPRPRVWWIAGAVAVSSIAGTWIGDGEVNAAGLVGVGWSVAAVFAGQLLAARGERLAADRERQQAAHEQALTRERLRIAHDLHDSVAHAMATINVQSGVAAHLLERRPEQARPALEAIRQASSEVLDELGAILGALRRDDESAPRAPLADLGRLDELVDRARADGLAVVSRVDGAVEAVPAAVSAAAYRVVQESLSNVRRHAGPDAAAKVTVSIGGPGAVEVEVVDDGGRRTGAVRPAGAGFGLGLAGMCERVESTGGRLSAGADPAGGFRVHAVWGVGERETR